MTRRTLIVRRAADLDLHEAATWYEGQRPGLGSELLVETREMLETIQNRPESFPITYRQARPARLKRFPYAIYFQVRDDYISVIAILHASRDHGQLLPDRG
jgi:hypothetical protein